MNIYFNKETIFKGETNFLNADFKGFANFEKARFCGETNFSDVGFGEEVIFRNAVFEKDVDFPEATFKGAEFENCTFNANVNFCDTQFDDWADFTRAKFTGITEFMNAKFLNGTDFSETEYEARASFENITVEKDIYFVEAIFHKLADFDGVTLKKGADFRKCNFNELVEFRNAFLDESLFNQCSFAGITDFSDSEVRKIHFQNANIQHVFIFEKVKIKEAANFEQTIFAGETRFNDSAFPATKFSSALFNENVAFRNVKFMDEVNFNDAKFQRKADFTGALFKKTVSFSRIIADDLIISWTQIKGKLKNHQEGHYKEAMEEYGLLKTLFEKRNEYNDMDEAYRMFKRFERKSQNASLARPMKLLRNFINFLILDIGSGYGTKPRNVAIMTFVVILLFGAFYNFFSDQLIVGSLTEPNSMSKGFLFCTYYSFVTFVTMGAENLYPNYQGWLKYVVAIQAFSGFFLMTLFVATFTRKVIR